MGLIEIASNNSVWRGMDYYKNKKVVSWKILEKGVYEGIVSGNEDNVYTVHIKIQDTQENLFAISPLRREGVLCASI